MKTFTACGKKSVKNSLRLHTIFQPRDSRGCYRTCNRSLKAGFH